MVISYRKNSPVGQRSVPKYQPSRPALGMVRPPKVRWPVIAPPKGCHAHRPVLSGSPHLSNTNDVIYPSGSRL